jgi:hypothetical protein
MTTISFEQKELALKDLDNDKKLFEFFGKSKSSKNQTQKIIRTNSKILF